MFPYQFIHESVRQHLLSGGLASSDPTLRQNLGAKRHARIAEACQKHVELMFAGQGLSESYSISTGLYLKRNYPIAAYSAKNLLYHVNLAFTGGAIDLISLENFPLRYVVLIQRYFNTGPNGLDSLHAEHPSALLYFLLLHDCELLAKALLQQLGWISDEHVRSGRF